MDKTLFEKYINEMRAMKASAIPEPKRPAAVVYRGNDKDMTGSGTLKIRVTSVRGLYPVANAKVTVLGEVKNPGSYQLNNGGMTLLEALGAAGDLTQFGRRDNILITRENNGKIEFARLNLQSKDIFTSPYFYLQQNDVVYVEPNQARTTSNQSLSLWLSLVGTLSSATTVVVSVLSATGHL